MSHWHCQLLYLVAKRLYVYAIGGTQSGTICKKLFTTHSLQSTHIISWHSAEIILTYHLRSINRCLKLNSTYFWYTINIPIGVPTPPALEKTKLKATRNMANP